MRGVMRLLLLLLVPAVQAGGIAVYTHSLEQAAIKRDGVLQAREHGGVRAFYLALVGQLLRDMQQPDQVVELPLVRGLQQLASHERVMLFNVYRTPQREGLYRWIGPLLHDRSMLYQRTDHSVQLASLAEARFWPVCALRGGAHAQKLQDLGFANVTLNSSYAGCLRMLAAGRVALAALSESDYQVKRQEAGVPAEALRASGVVLMENDGYIAVSLAMPQDEVDKWNQALLSLRQSGVYQTLQHRYLR